MERKISPRLFIQEIPKRKVRYIYYLIKQLQVNNFQKVPFLSKKIIYFLHSSNVEFPFKFFDKSVNKSDCLKIINLQYQGIIYLRKSFSKSSF